MTWRTDMENAPRDGTPVELKLESGWRTDACWDGPVTGASGDVWTWFAVDEDDYPESWTEAVCWECNEDYERSDWPVAWRPLADERVEPS